MASEQKQASEPQASFVELVSIDDSLIDGAKQVQIKELISELKRIEPAKKLRRTNGLMCDSKAWGEKAHAIAAVLIDLYNQGWSLSVCELESSFIVQGKRPQSLFEIKRDIKDLKKSIRQLLEKQSHVIKNGLDCELKMLQNDLEEQQRLLNEKQKYLEKMATPKRDLETLRIEEKRRVQVQERTKRDEQLREEKVYKFIKDMQDGRPNLGSTRFVSIQNVMRDGRDLRSKIEQVLPKLQTLSTPDQIALLRSEGVVDPYIQFAEAGIHCEHTGLSLADIWKYFRHTWSNQYKSVPGRSIHVLIRDRAALDHPVIGIAALGSSVMQISVRDTEICWNYSSKTLVFLLEYQARIKSSSSPLPIKEWMDSWLDKFLPKRPFDREDSRIYVDDLVEVGVLSHELVDNPTAGTVKAFKVAREKYIEEQKSTASNRLQDAWEEDWFSQPVPKLEQEAKSELFLKKRGSLLESLLEAKSRLLSIYRIVEDFGAARASDEGLLYWALRYALYASLSEQYAADLKSDDRSIRKTVPNLYSLSQGELESQLKNMIGSMENAAAEKQWDGLKERCAKESKYKKMLQTLMLISHQEHKLLADSIACISQLAQRSIQLLHESDFSFALKSILKQARGEQVGIALADITVCGAIAPYNHVLGGKLVSMLMTSPEVVYKYYESYKHTESVIASSIAGRTVVKEPRLVMLNTTSLYGAGSSQYNRISIPSSCFVEDEVTTGVGLKYIDYGKTLGYGTSQFTEATVRALGELDTTEQHAKFGKGVSPRMRKILSGLKKIKVASEVMKHGRQRIVYGIPLISNLTEFLLGFEAEPKYVYPALLSSEESAQLGTKSIASWWMERWFLKRIQHPDTKIQTETFKKLDQEHFVLAFKEGIGSVSQHNAFVPLPEDVLRAVFEPDTEDDEPGLFDDLEW